VTHAEWYVEVVDTYCKTVMIASHLRPKLNEIPPDKIADLLAIKKKMGLPDSRLESGADAIDPAEGPRHRTAEPQQNSSEEKCPGQYEIDELVSRLTLEVSAFLNGDE
jgi:L-fuculose-phosphate aldolase